MKNTGRAIVNLLKNMKKSVRTMTYDYNNGKEFADHQKIAKALRAKIYFARPYKSCDRGLNEHTNGLIRQYLPKKQDFEDVSHLLHFKFETAKGQTSSEVDTKTGLINYRDGILFCFK